MVEKYSVYSKFDLEMHKKTFVNYLEVVIDEEGTVEYAVPSHQEKLIAIACVKLGVTRQELSDMCPEEYFADFGIWLSKMSGCCMVWNDFVMGYDFSAKQIIALKHLKENGVYFGKVPEKNERVDLGKRKEKNKIMVDFDETLDNLSALEYYEDNTEMDGGEQMTSKEVLASALRSTGKTQAEAAANIGWAPQQLSARLSRNSLRADEFLNLLEGLGIEFTLTVKESGQVIRSHIQGAGRRVKCMVDRITYDTAASDALSNNFYADGANMYTDGKALELYIDKEGRYFFAEYSSWEGVKDRITPVTPETAAAFIEKYGTDIYKAPKTE